MEETIYTWLYNDVTGVWHYGDWRTYAVRTSVCGRWRASGNGLDDWDMQKKFRRCKYCENFAHAEFVKGTEFEVTSPTNQKEVM